MTTRILSSSFNQILNTNPETGNTIVEIAGGYVFTNNEKDLWNNTTDSLHFSNLVHLP